MPPIHCEPPEQCCPDEGITRQLPGDLRRQLRDVHARRRQSVVPSDGANWQQQHERRRHILPGALSGLHPKISVERLYAALERGPIMLGPEYLNTQGFLGILRHPSDTGRLAIAARRVAQPIVHRLAPVYGSSWPSRIPFPTAHPLWAGNLSTKAADTAARLADYDAIFALGGKSLIAILYTEGPAVPPGCAVFQMSADARDLGRTFVTPLSVVGDIKASLQALAPLLQAATAPNAAAYQALRLKAREAQQNRRRQLALAAAAQMEAPVTTPLVAAQEVVRAIGPDIPIVDETFATSAHVRGFLNSNSSRQYSFLRGGALGWSMPAAVGCSLGLGREPVVCLVGDGAAMYSPQALWTAAHQKLPVTFIVFNNREYNVLKNFMRGQADYVSAQSNRFIAMELDKPAVDFQAMAQSMGVPARRIEKATDIAPAVKAAIASETNLVEIVIGVA